MSHKLIKRLQRECVTDLNIFLEIILLTFLAIIITIILKEEDLYFKIMIISNMLILPFLIRVYFYLKTKEIKNQGIIDKKSSCHFKIFEMKEDSRNYIKRTQYIACFSGIVPKIIVYISDAILIMLVLAFAGAILIFLTSRELSYIFFWGLAGLLLFSFLYLWLINIILNPKRKSILKFLSDFGIYLLSFSPLIFVLNLLIAPFMSKLSTNESIKELLMMNSHLENSYQTLAQISFLIFAGSFVVMGVLYSYFEKRNEIKNKLEAYRESLLLEYKRYLGQKSQTKENFKEFMKLYLKEEIKVELDKTIISLMFPIDFFKKVILKYGFFGISFILYPLILHEKGDGVTLDVLLLSLFIFFIIDSRKIYSKIP